MSRRHWSRAAAAWRGEDDLENALDAGEVQGRQSFVIRLLEQRFGALPAAVRRQIEAIESTGSLTRLAEAALLAGSLEELGLGGQRESF